MQTTVDPATVKTRWWPVPKVRLDQTALPHDRAEHNLDFWKSIACFELRM